MPRENRAPKIMLIRHAEKPAKGVFGVALTGEMHSKSLSVRGWQRAGALAVYFNSLQGGAIAKPEFLFASHSSSLRPESTLVPLAEKLGLTINLDYGKGDEEQLVSAAAALNGPVLISWQHDFMAEVANAVLEDRVTAPQIWPAERFDMTWVLDLKPDAASYGFTQVPQNLLGGDSLELIT